MDKEEYLFKIVDRVCEHLEIEITKEIGQSLSDLVMLELLNEEMPKE